MRRDRTLAALLALGLVMAADPALAQGGGAAGQPESTPESHPLIAQAGAGTTDGTTTGDSGPQKKGGSGPTQSDASLCSDYQGVVRSYCLYTVLKEADHPAGG